MERLRERFMVGRICVVADRGMIAAASLKALQDRKLEYVLGARERSSNLIRKVVLKDQAPFTPLLIERARGETQLFVKEVRAGDHRYIVCRNEVEAEKDRSERQAIIAGLANQLKPNFRTLGSAGGGKAQKRWVFGARFGNVVLNNDLSNRDHQPIRLTFLDIMWCPWRETRMPRHVRSRQEDRWLRVSVSRRECPRGRAPCPARHQGAGPAR
jgi:hypothetical protein